MIVRRKFIQGIACGLGVAGAAAASTKTVKYRIEGFTCLTCAVGLDTLLKEQKGIVRSQSSYRERTTVVEYRPELIGEPQIKGVIEELGFHAK